MLNKSLLYLLLFAGLFISETGFAQKYAVEMNTGGRIDISKIKIKDTVLIMHLTQFINKQLNEDSLFRKKGYIQVFLAQTSQKPNVVRSYYISKNYLNFDNLANDKQFPMFYSFLLNKMILFNNYDLFETFDIEYTKKSKVKFRKELEPYLFEAQTIVFTDKENKKQKLKNFRPDEVFHTGRGINVYIMNDGKVVVD
jgi:hypothetical protein